MKSLLIVLALAASAAEGSFIGGLYPAAVPYTPAVPYYAPYAAHSTQHNSADEYGNYNYGYANVNSQKQESGNAYGGIKGQYSYVDGYGVSQTVNYVADDYGFRASGSNLVNSADALRHKRSIGYPYAAGVGHFAHGGAHLLAAAHVPTLHAAPVVHAAVHAAPALHAVPAVHAAAPHVPAVHAAAPHVPAIHAAPHSAIASSQYRTQDEHDNFSFGYANENSQRTESGNAYGGVTGSYSYVDAYGKPHTVNYVADDLGFRATGTDLVNSAYANRAYRKKRSLLYPGYPAYVPGYPLAHPITPYSVGGSRSQYHSQDEYDNYNYGYRNINSQKTESGNAHDVVKGSYSYLDGYGQSQTVNYVADGYGFRASGTNLVNSADAINVHH